MGVEALHDEGLRCPRCDYDKVRASDGWCWRCGYLLPEGWVGEQ